MKSSAVRINKRDDKDERKVKRGGETDLFSHFVNLSVILCFVVSNVQILLIQVWEEDPWSKNGKE